MAKKVSDVMSKRLITVPKETSLTESSALMKEKSIRHLLIVEPSNGVMSGMISDRDIKKFMSPFIGSTRATAQDTATGNVEVGRVMVTKDKIVIAKPDDDVKNVIEKMLMKKFGSIPVVDEQGKAVGIVTRGDLLKLLLSML